MALVVGGELGSHLRQMLGLQFLTAQTDLGGLCGGAVRDLLPQLLLPRAAHGRRVRMFQLQQSGLLDVLLLQLLPQVFPQHGLLLLVPVPVHEGLLQAHLLLHFVLVPQKVLGIDVVVVPVQAVNFVLFALLPLLLQTHEVLIVSLRKFDPLSHHLLCVLQCLPRRLGAAWGTCIRQERIVPKIVLVLHNRVPRLQHRLDVLVAVRHPDVPPLFLDVRGHPGPTKICQRLLPKVIGGEALLRRDVPKQLIGLDLPGIVKPDDGGGQGVLSETWHQRIEHVIVGRVGHRMGTGACGLQVRGHLSCGWIG
mmetsp:Transcript_37945/g.62967  ORF Transcript_37945/g.62967 Transcript_37945/m.62967 type:complete len:308 (+) Transcript_37945:2860-3783(+)